MAGSYPVAYRTSVARSFQRVSAEIIRPFRFMRSAPYVRPQAMRPLYSMPKVGYGQTRYGTPPAVRAAYRAIGTGGYIARGALGVPLASLYALGSLYRYGPFTPDWWRARASAEGYFAGWTKTVQHAAPDGVASHFQAPFEFVVGPTLDAVRVFRAAHIGDQSQSAALWPAVAGAVSSFTAAAFCNEYPSTAHYRTHSDYSSAVAADPRAAYKVNPALHQAPLPISPAVHAVPMLMPIGVPVAFPGMLPRWFPRPSSNPLGEQLRPPPSRPPREVVVVVRAGGSTVSSRPALRPRKPGRKVRERKIIANISSATSLGRWISRATEAEDFVDAIYQALPVGRRAFETRYGRLGRRYLVEENPSGQEKLRRLWAYSAEIDWMQALYNLAVETAQDRAFGWVGRRMASAVQQAHESGYGSARPVGYQTGPLH